MRRSGSSPSSRAVRSMPVVLAEPDVDQRDVGRERLDELLALGGRAGGADHVAPLAAEQQLEPLPERLVIFDEDKAKGHHWVYIGSCDQNPRPPVVPQTRQFSVPELQRRSCPRSRGLR